MKMKTLTRSLVLALAAVLVLASCGKASKKIIIASDCTWPPMEFINADKAIVGFDVDLVNEIAKAGGFEVEVRNTAWDGIFAGLANGQYQAVISSVTITDERKAAMDFSDPYINAGQVLVVPAADNTSQTLADLVGKSVGAQMGTTGAKEIGKVSGVKLKDYDELGLAIEDLANNRIAGVVCDTPIAANYVLQNDNYKGKLKIVGSAFTEEYYGIAVNKGDKKTLDLINKGLKAVKDSGKLEELESKWLR
jgi:polar amino acid transport system substrate-binding protein